MFFIQALAVGSWIYLFAFGGARWPYISTRAKEERERDRAKKEFESVIVTKLNQANFKKPDNLPLSPFFSADMTYNLAAPCNI